MRRIMLLTLALSAVAAAQPSCGPYSVRGTYLVTSSGWIVSAQAEGQAAPIPAMLMGVASVTFSGEITMSGTVNFAGQQAEFEAEGSFDVKPDCTGSARARVRLAGSTEWGSPMTYRIVVLPEEKEIHQFHTTPGDMGLGIWKRMSPVVNAAKW